MLHTRLRRAAERSQDRKQLVRLVMVFLIAVTAMPLRAGGSGPEGIPDLASCPDRPNCVSSLATDRDRRVEPLKIGPDSLAEMERLRSIVASMPGATVVRYGPGFLDAEFRSRIFRFVDDVSFRLGQGDDVIHLRSASRTGYWDLGMNRKRIEEIRRRFQVQ